MSTIIAIETSTELASAALLHNGQLLSREAHGVQIHSQTILPMVQELLANASMALTDCDAIAFGAGPGSFTGVRTACGVAQGLAYGAELPVVPIVTLQAMAHACQERNGASNVLVVLDARMQEVYWAQYRFDGQWSAIVEPTLSAPTSVKPIAITGCIVNACGNGLLAYANDFTHQSFMTNAEANIGPHAIDVARLADSIFRQNGGVPAHEAQPIYLRNKVALTTHERMAIKAQAKT